MAGCEDGFVPVDALADKALTDAVWAYVQGPGVSELQWGTTVAQEEYVIRFIGQQYGKTVTSIRTASTRDDLLDETFDHLVVVENNLLGDNENHWLLRRKGADWTQGGFMHVDDSALSLDLGPDQYPVDAVLAAAYRLVGQGNQFGWLWSYSR